MNEDRLAEIKDRLARARKEQRFYGPYSALEDIAWLVEQAELARELGDALPKAFLDRDRLREALRRIADDGVVGYASPQKKIALEALGESTPDD